MVKALLGIVLFMVTSMIMTAYAQTWAGIFTVDHACNKTTCCCFSSELFIEKHSNHSYKFRSSLEGQHCKEQKTFEMNATNITERTVTLSKEPLSFNFTLDADDKTIKILYDNNATCVSTAQRKSSAVKQFGNTITLIPSILIGLTYVIFNLKP